MTARVAVTSRHCDRVSYSAESVSASAAGATALSTRTVCRKCTFSSAAVVYAALIRSSAASSAVRVGGNGGLSAVYRNDGKRVQLAAGGNEIALEFLLRQQGSGCPHRPGLQAQRQVIVRAGNSGCAGFNRVYCVQQRCAVLDNTGAADRPQAAACPAWSAAERQQEQQSEYAQRTDRRRRPACRRTPVNRLQTGRSYMRQIVRSSSRMSRRSR